MIARRLAAPEPSHHRGPSARGVIGGLELKPFDHPCSGVAVQHVDEGERYQRDMVEAVSASPEQPRALGDAMVAFFDAAIGFYCAGSSPGCLVLCTAPAEAAADEDIRAALAGVLAEIESHITARVERAAAEGTDVPDARAVVTLLSALLVAIAIQARAGVPEPELRALARTSVGAALRRA